MKEACRLYPFCFVTIRISLSVLNLGDIKQVNEKPSVTTHMLEHLVGLGCFGSELAISALAQCSA